MTVKKQLIHLTKWQKAVYKLCWTAGLDKGQKGREAGRKLDLMKKERPKEYEEAFEVWKTAMFEILG